MIEHAGSASIGEVLRYAARELAYFDTARLDAEVLLGHVLGCDRVALVRDRDRRIDATMNAEFAALVAARVQGQPVAQLRGIQEFWSINFYVNEQVLIPREETELLVATALAVLPRSRRITLADLGTGCGAVALALGSELSEATILALDRSPAALQVARCNQRRLRLDNVHLLQSDWLSAVRGNTLDAVLANPPYIAADDPLLQYSSLRYEPMTALASGLDGLSDLAAITAAAPHVLVDDGWLMLEHSASQGARVRLLFENAGFSAVATMPDLAGLERVTVGRKTAKKSQRSHPTPRTVAAENSDG
ncbi:MAG: peptide chain release factor N(5)-glutamine methyltransferase [Gammaproteobacteria bacterium]